MKKLKKEAKCLLITSIFLGVVFISLLIASLISKLYGLVIGWSIGYAIAIVSMFLLFKSGELIAMNATGTKKSTALVVIFYISRFALYAAGLILCAVLSRVAKIVLFKYSLFTCVCALLPSHLLIAIFYHDEEDNKVAVNNNTNSKEK